MEKNKDLINFIFEDYLKKSGYNQTLIKFYEETNKNFMNNKELEYNIYSRLNLIKNENTTIINQILTFYNESILMDLDKFQESVIHKKEDENNDSLQTDLIFFTKKNSIENNNESIKKEEKNEEKIEEENEEKNDSIEQKKNKNSRMSTDFSYKNHLSCETLKEINYTKVNNIKIDNKIINESFKSHKSFPINNNSFNQEVKQHFNSLKDLIKNYNSFIKESEKNTKKILKNKYVKKNDTSKSFYIKKKSKEFKDVTKTYVERNIIKSNPSVFSKYIYILYYEKFHLFKKENKKQIINFDIKCSICQKNIKNNIFCFKNSDDPEINNVNSNYHICNKCFRESISQINSNILSLFLYNKPEEKKITDDYDIFIEFTKLTLKKNKKKEIEIKNNGEINLYHMYCLSEYNFNLKFKYINCSNGNVKQLNLYKNDGCDVVPVYNIEKDKNYEINFKFKKINKNYVGRFKKQIYFKSNDKKESEKFTFYVNILKIPKISDNGDSDSDDNENKSKNKKDDKNEKKNNNESDNKINSSNKKDKNNKNDEDDKKDNNSNNDNENESDEYDSNNNSSDNEDDEDDLD